MGRSFTQVLWMTFSMTCGCVSGIKAADYFFWNDDLKYKLWEEIETEYWETYPKPSNIEAVVKFDSVINPGTVYYSYLPPASQYIEEDYMKRYQM